MCAYTHATDTIHTPPPPPPPTPTHPQNWPQMTLEELLAQVPTLKPPAAASNDMGIIPEILNHNHNLAPRPPAPQQPHQPPATPIAANGAVPISYPSPRAVPPTPHARDAGAPSPPTAHKPAALPAAFGGGGGGGGGGGMMLLPSKAPRPTAKEAIREAFKHTQGMFSTTIRGARTKTTNLCVSWVVCVCVCVCVCVREGGLGV
jgi:hypothetical protein